jgi:hypothetical protein
LVDDGWMEQVVVWGCRALDSIIPGPNAGLNKFEWFSTRLRPINSSTLQKKKKRFSNAWNRGALIKRPYKETF